MKRHLSVVINILVILTFGCYVTVEIGWDSIIKIMKMFWPQAVLLCCLAQTAAVVVGATRIHVILRPLSSITFRRVLVADFVATAVGIFTPGSVGLPVTLVALLRKEGVTIKQAVFIIATDRSISVLVMLCLAGTGSLLLLGSFWGRMTVELPGILFFIPLLLGTGMLFIGRRRLEHLAMRARDILANLQEGYRNKGYLFVVNAILALISVGIATAIWQVLLRTTGVNVGSFHLFVLIPLISILAYVPVSFLGLGVQDMGSILVFSTIGVPAEAVVACLLVFRCLSLSFALTGLILRNQLLAPVGTGKISVSIPLKPPVSTEASNWSPNQKQPL